MKNTAKFKGEKLKEARETKGMSQHDLSLALYEREINLTPATLSNYENEKTSPDIDVMMIIAQVLGKQMDYFFA